jgi:hypothetical protein
MTHARLIRWSLLPGMAALMFVMLFGVDVIVETLVDTPGDALGPTILALAAISMAGAVLTAHTVKTAELR